jgi:hypothetical protein
VTLPFCVYLTPSSTEHSVSHLNLIRRLHCHRPVSFSSGTESIN